MRSSTWPIALGLKGMQIERNAQAVMEYCAALQTDFIRFRDDFELVGKHLTNAQGKFSAAEKRLDKFELKLDRASEEQPEIVAAARAQMTTQTADIGAFLDQLHDQLTAAAAERETLPCGLVFRSVGYHGVELPGILFDSKSGTIPNEGGRVEPGVYWEGGGGLRVEDNFLVTKDGLEKLSAFPDGVVRC